LFLFLFLKKYSRAQAAGGIKSENSSSLQWRQKLQKQGKSNKQPHIHAVIMM